MTSNQLLGFHEATGLAAASFPIPGLRDIQQNPVEILEFTADADCHSMAVKLAALAVIGLRSDAANG